MVEKAEKKFENNLEFIIKEVDAEFGVHMNYKKGLVKWLYF
jgi:hypothetical protein